MTPSVTPVVERVTRTLVTGSLGSLSAKAESLHRDALMTPRTEPPEAWTPAHQLARRLVEPVERFLQIQTASGVVLAVAATAALVWANSPWGESYEAFFDARLTVELGPLRTSETLRFWIDEGLMVLFFFVVGLEVRREIHEGELSTPRRASLPLAAAIGGMIAPASVYIAFNYGSPAIAGWGVPMATDIAFALAVLTLLGRRVPPALRVLLLALAIVDDIGATLAIALFYSSGVALEGVLLAAAGVLAVVVMQRMGVRSAIAYVPAGALLWLGMHHAGVHPTLAGVVLGLMTPVRTWLGEDDAVRITREALRDYRSGAKNDDEDAVGRSLERIAWVPREAVSPLARLERGLHGWVAFGVMPLFALANGGIPLFEWQGEVDWAVALGTGLGLVVGKPLGIVGASWVTARLGLTALPRGVSWAGLTVVGLLGGVGFTMAMFITNLAHPSSTAAMTKVAIFVGSTCAAGLALIVGRALLPPEPEAGAASSAAEAERSTAV